ncbi:MAG: hypothetical protein LBQ14_04805 [Treponema sp.]|jgi:hypothetical protein|nr:hypothetical protein [Treponema sp.]
MKLGIFVFLVAVLTLSGRPVFALFTPDNRITAARRLKITGGDWILAAVVIDSETARDFLTLLPMTVKANDYINREKYWPLPKALAAGHDRQREYERGDLGFWPSANAMALFYNHDGSLFPNPGLIVVAKITSNPEIFNRYPGPVELKIELAD